MSRERENVSAQLTQAEQVKLVAEGELAEVSSISSLLANRLHVVSPGPYKLKSTF